MLGGCDDGTQPEDVTTPASDASAATTPVISEQAIVTALESASNYVSRGDLASARTILEGVVEKAPSDVRPVEKLGQVLYSQSLQARDPDTAADLRQQAADAYRRAVELDPDSAGLRHSAALIMLAAGDDASALRMFEAAAELDPANPQHPLFAAQLHIRAGRYDEAEAALQRVLELEPDQPHARASVALIAMERGDFADAKRQIGLARAGEPTNLDFRAQEARILRRSGEPHQALQLLMGLPQHHRAERIIASEIAAAYREIGLPERAAQAWQMCYSHDIRSPERWYAAAKAAEALIDAGQREQALIWIRHAEMAAPDEPLVIELRAKLAASSAEASEPDGQ